MSAIVDVITGAGYSAVKTATVSLYDAKGDLQSHLNNAGLGGSTKEMIPGANDWLRAHGMGFLVPSSPLSNQEQKATGKTTGDYLVSATVSQSAAKKLGAYTNMSADDARKAIDNPDVFIGDPNHDRNAPEDKKLSIVQVAILGLSGILILKLILK